MTGSRARTVPRGPRNCPLVASTFREINVKPALFLAIPLAAVALAACSTPQGSAAPTAAAADPCTAHRQAASPEARRAAAEAHIVQMHGSATPDHVERHLRMMEQRCPPA